MTSEKKCHELRGKGVHYCRKEQVDGGVQIETGVEMNGWLAERPGRGLGVQNGIIPLYSTLAWKIPWTEELGGLQSMGSRRVRHD